MSLGSADDAPTSTSITPGSTIRVPDRSWKEVRSACSRNVTRRACPGWSATLAKGRERSASEPRRLTGTSSSPRFRNENGSVAIVVLNTGTTPDTVSFALRHLGIRNAALATPYLTDSSSDTAAQPPVPVVRGTLTATLPARSLVTFAIR